MLDLDSALVRNLHRSGWKEDRNDDLSNCSSRAVFARWRWLGIFSLAWLTSVGHLTGPGPVPDDPEKVTRLRNLNRRLFSGIGIALVG